MKTAKDLYKLLELSKEASQEDVRRAYRRLVREHHPDANPEDSRAEERFKEIQQAYEILSDPEKRREYDRRLSTSSSESSDRPRARAGRQTGGRTTSTVDLSDLLQKLRDRLGDRTDGRGAASFQLRGEEIARVAKLLGLDIASLSERLGENVRINAKASFGDSGSDGFPVEEEDIANTEPSGVSDGRREKKVKGPRARVKEKKVKGPKARRNRGDD